MLFDGIGQETGGAEVDDDRTRVDGAKMVGQNSIFQSVNGIGLRPHLLLLYLRRRWPLPADKASPTLLPSHAAC